MIAIHITARAHPGLYPLQNHANCSVLWNSLSRKFPDAIACVLMPNHIHILLHAKHPRAAQDLKRKLAIQLRAFARRTHKASLWQPISPPREIPDLLHLKRQIRYVHRNPCRARLTTDPITWPWSTHRDVLGMVWPAWTGANRMATLLDESPRGFRPRFHHYVSADQPTPQGTPMILEELRLLDEATPERLRAAVRTAVRDKNWPLILAGILRSQPESAQRLRSHSRILKIPASTLLRHGRKGLKLLRPEIRTALALTLHESALHSGTRRATQTL